MELLLIATTIVTMQYETYYNAMESCELWFSLQKSLRQTLRAFLVVQLK